MAKRKYAFRGKRLSIPVGTQEKYAGAIVDLTNQMTADINSSLKDLFSRDFATDHFAAMAGDDVGTMDASISSQTRILINALKRRYDQLFGNLAFGLSSWLMDALNRSSAAAVRSSIEGAPNLKKEGRKLTLDVQTLDQPTHDILKAESNKAAAKIRSVPQEYIGKISDAVYNSIATGNGMADLEPFLEKQAGHVANWAHNVAMDQTRKVFNGLNMSRVKKQGITRGEWLHSGGSNHPRELHVDFDGQTFDLDKGAPVGDQGGNYVVPGEEPYCRCTFAPVIEFNDDEEDD